MVDHHDYYVTNGKTKTRQAITDTSITLVERKTRVEKKFIYRRDSTYPKKSRNIQRKKKLKLRHEGGEQDKITNKKSSTTENVKKIPSQT